MEDEKTPEQRTCEQPVETPAEEKGKHNKRSQVEHAFTYHPPRPGQQEKYQLIREKAKDLAFAILDLTPECREQSIALTDLEKVVMMANAAIARHS